MSATRTCPRCGAALRDGALEGLCQDCLGKLALGASQVSGFEFRVSGVEASPGAPPVANPHPAFGHPLPSDGRGAGGEGQRFGDYELLEEIAHGGMGVVYKARQTSLNRTVAVKMIRAGPFASKEFVHRFRVEASAAAVLQHPNIVAVHEVGVHEGQHFFSMDYVAGKNLAQIVRDGPLPANRAARYVQKIAEAIHYAHQSGILHRDLKPSNVLIDQNDQPRITDFGLAKQLNNESSATLTGEVMGTPGYMPPEQASGNRGAVKAWSDVYALGAILYHLLTGRAPFAAGSLEETLNQVLHQDPVSIRLLNPAVARDLDTICLKCLEKEPGKRYTSAQLLAEELTRFLNKEPILARPISSVGKAWRWCRRKPPLAAALALVCVVAVGSPIAALRINYARKLAETNRELAEARLYASDMNLAQQALKLNNLGTARRLLNRHRPQPGEEDLRGWEWRYLWQLTRSSALGTLTNRSVRGFPVSFSPDGTRLAVGWYDGHVDLWDVPSRRLVRVLTDREYRHPGRVAFSPVRNLLAATSEPKVVTLYDLDSGRESVLWRAPDPGAWDVRDLAFSQDGSRVVIYAGSIPNYGGEVWVVNASSSEIESHHPTVCSDTHHHGAAQLSPDNRRLYLARSEAQIFRYSIQCLDLTTGRELWQTESQRDFGLTTLAVSPDGRVLASGSGFEDPSIRVWDAATGRLVVRLDGHTGWVGKVAFTKDGRRLISAASDQTIRFWDLRSWTEMKVLRGHTDEVHAVALSDTAQLVASTSRDGDLMLWKEDGNSAVDGYSRLPEKLLPNEVLPLDHSRVLLLPPGQPPEWVDLKRDSAPVPLPELGSSTNVLGWFGTNLLCHWNGTNRILVREFRRAEFSQRGAIALDSGTLPTRLAYDASRQVLAWSEPALSNSVYLASLAAPDRRIELKGDVPGLVPLRFSDDGKYLAGIKRQESLRVWNVEAGQIVASINGRIIDAVFAAGGRVLVVVKSRGNDHEIGFHDLAHADRAPRWVPGRNNSRSLAVSPDGGLVASSTDDGLVRLFDPARGEWIEDLHGHLHSVFKIAFSPDGRRLISTSLGRQAVKLWDVGTRQELLTLGGTGPFLQAARWSADGDVILAGRPWQAWRAPSWKEIAAVEAKDKPETKQP